MARRPLTPASSAYRVQLHAGFDFDAAAAIVPYLSRLGITHLYCSPYLQAVPGIRRQPYRLSRWTRARTQLNYRRFFDVDGLVGVRVEREEVFAATHALLLDWVADGSVDGLRVDHPDGLRDPGAYLDRCARRRQTSGSESRRSSNPARSSSTVEAVADEEHRTLVVRRGSLVVAANLGAPGPVGLPGPAGLLLASRPAETLVDAGAVHLGSDSVAVLRREDAR